MMSLLKALSDPAYWEEVANQGRNFGQATSNAVAQVATAPVDLMNMGLGFAGLGSKRPVGGTEWLKELGLYRDVPQGAAQVAGETLGNVLPVAIPAKASQIAGGLLKAIANASKPTTMGSQRGAVVWHGSPHKFDKFDASKIGTGEGAQVYGHGLYFADSPGVAKSYRDTLNIADFQRKAQKTDGYDQWNSIQDNAYLLLKNKEFSRDQRRLLNSIRKNDDYFGYDHPHQGVIAALKKQVDDVSPQTQKLLDEYGSLLQVNLPDDAIAKMLNYDAPLKQQPANVLRFVEDYAPNWLDATNKLMPDAMTGKSFMKTFQRYPNGKRAGLEEAMQGAGVPGVKYLDGMSRRRGDGTSNYVVFPGEEGLLSIISRNGVPIK